MLRLQRTTPNFSSTSLRSSGEEKEKPDSMFHLNVSFFLLGGPKSNLLELSFLLQCKLGFGTEGGVG